MTQRPNRSLPLLALIVLAVCAVANGVYLTMVHVDYTTGVDTVAGACQGLAEHGCAVTAGRFGAVAGIPVAAIGLAGGASILVCAVAAYRKRDALHDGYRSLLLVLTGFSVFASVIMGMLSSLEGSFCPFCLIWYGLNIGLFAAAFIARNRDLRPTDVLDDVTGNGAFVVLGVFGVVLVSAVLWHHNRLATQMAEQEAEIEANAPAIAARILEKNETFAKGPVDVPAMRDNPTKLVGGATAAEADVVIVEFADFQCPFCQKLWTGMHDYLEQTDRSIRVHFAHYPLNSACNPGVNDLHPDACQAAVAGVCAEAQGKFWEFGDVVFPNQTSLDRDDLLDYAKEAGLDPNALATCMDDPKSMGQVRYDIGMGNKIDLSATPMFLINGYPVTGAFPPPVLEEIIKQVLAHDAGENPEAAGA